MFRCNFTRFNLRVSCEKDLLLQFEYKVWCFPIPGVNTGFHIRKISPTPNLSGRIIKGRGGGAASE